MAVYNKKLPQIKMLDYWFGKINNKPIEIDILGLNDDLALISECKFRNKEFNEDDLNKLINNTNFINKKHKLYLIFNNSNFNINKRDNIITISLDELIG